MRVHLTVEGFRFMGGFGVEGFGVGVEVQEVRVHLQGLREFALHIL